MLALKACFEWKGQINMELQQFVDNKDAEIEGENEVGLAWSLVNPSYHGLKNLSKWIKGREMNDPTLALTAITQYLLDRMNKIGHLI